MLNPRELRHRIDLDEKQIKQDQETGDSKETWIEFAKNVPAKISPLSVREYLSSQAMQSQVTTRITIRSRSGLKAALRIRHNGKIYNPQGWFADPDSGLEYVTAPCTEGVNNG